MPLETSDARITPTCPRCQCDIYVPYGKYDITRPFQVECACGWTGLTMLKLSWHIEQALIRLGLKTPSV